MALDQQRNWDVAMAENLQQVMSKQQQCKGSELDLAKWYSASEPRRHVHLPDEIIVLILDHLATAQTTLAACCYLSRQWHEAVLPYLYTKPQLYGKGFDLFTRTICPSINLHVRKSPLSSLIRELDLGRLVHQGSKSVTARLLGRTKNTLEIFRAPQASFAINCLPALAKCANLRILDMSLVSESPPLPELLKAIAGLEHLNALRLPRSSGYGGSDIRWKVSWPPRLRSLALSGGIDSHFLRGQFPPTLQELVIEHCPHMSSAVLTWFLAEFIRPLPHFERIKIAHMPRFDEMAMNDVLYILPQIKQISVSVDHITPDFFSGGNTDLWSTVISKLGGDTPMIPFRHENLQLLELTSSGSPNPVGKINPHDLLDALDDENLPALRVVRVPKNLCWAGGEHEDDANTLTAELQALDEVDCEDASNEEVVTVDHEAPGLWIYDE